MSPIAVKIGASFVVSTILAVILFAAGGAVASTFGVILAVVAFLLLLSLVGMLRDPQAVATAQARIDARRTDAPATITPARTAAAKTGTAAFEDETGEGFTVTGNRAQRRAAERQARRK